MNAERLLAYYEHIADAPDAIVRLRRFILDLAVRGKLVPQDPTEETPDKNLQRARRRLETLAAKTERLRWQPTEQIRADALEISAPNGWLPATVNDTGLYINGLAFKQSDWKLTGLPIIRIQNLTDPTKEFNYADGSFPDEVIVRNGDLRGGSVRLNRI
jgi:type I restriction enzyme S subunit